MVRLNINSEFIETIGEFLRDSEDDPAWETRETYAGALDSFGSVLDRVEPRVTRLSATGLELTFKASQTWKLALTGSGFDPVSSIDDLVDAIDSGIASGSFDALTLRRGSTKIAEILFDASGYTVQSGGDSLRVTGSLPENFDQLFELVGLLGEDGLGGLEDMTRSERNALFSALGDFGITGISLSNGINTLMEIAVTETGLRLGVGPFALRLEGRFPTDFGQMAAVAYALAPMLEGDTAFDLDAIAGLDLDRMVMTGPGGAELFRVEGPLTDAASTEIESIRLDGKLISQDRIIVGESWAEGTGADELILGAPSFGDDEEPGDFLAGGGGNDRIHGYSGNDHLLGDAGHDRLVGGADADRLEGGSGNDTLDGGSGRDTVVFDPSNAVTVSLATRKAQQTGHGRDTLISIENAEGSAQNDRITGSKVANWLIGGSGHDRLSGLGGADTLTGGEGRDTLQGGAGSDLIDGGDGSDRMSGGSGADTFLFETGSGHDTITDFTQGEDVIRIDRAGISDFDDLEILADGSGARIVLGADSILLSVSATALEASDFFFG
ncbi:calcium-binding protein [Gemmobacter denitrificans]|uniref:Calcium-binding protein n=1 Tax=Gemmobacter denitrificans TaxID=3123040 RepID=A0ABU8BT18_9RHOB